MAWSLRGLGESLCRLAFPARNVVGAGEITEYGDIVTDQRSTDGWLAVPPFQQHIGIETASAADGRSLLRYTFESPHGNRKGDVHGGVLATLADLAISQAIRSLTPGIAGLSTINMTVNYIETARGDLVAEGRAVKVGGSIGFGETDIKDAGGRTVAQATAAFRIIRHKPSGDAGEALGDRAKPS